MRLERAPPQDQRQGSRAHRRDRFTGPFQLALHVGIAAGELSGELLVALAELLQEGRALLAPKDLKQHRMVGETQRLWRARAAVSHQPECRLALLGEEIDSPAREHR